jgi:hypothetical protein
MVHLIFNSASVCFNSTDHISACKKIRFRSISCTDNQLHYSVNKIIQSSTMNLNFQFTRRWSILATACRGLQGIWPARGDLICNSASVCFNSTDHISACKKIRFRSISCTDNQLHYSVNKIIQSSTMNLNFQFTRRWSILATACRGLQGIWPARGVAGMRLPSKLSTLSPAGSVLQGSWKLLLWTTSTI